ncbi:hypothetical protein ALC53_02329 [Atta colombica]|uniref:Uncharacterized protein n=1 Tax=Atta colombica TaxID=520822 RepID=A0A195BT11_9HYME|nr:hypothetical protein ALC53_02329 [Atta colombica]
MVEEKLAPSGRDGTKGTGDGSEIDAHAERDRKREGTVVKRLNREKLCEKEGARVISDREIHTERRERDRGVGGYQNGRARNLLHVLLLLLLHSPLPLFLCHYSYASTSSERAAPRHAETARRNAVRYNGSGLS